MRYWWVNQNQTFKHEVQGGFLWSPKRSKGDRRNPFYDTMIEVRAGDLVLSFCDTQIKAVGVAQGSAESATKPAFGNVGNQWDNEGWLVLVEFTEVESPVRPKDIIDDLRPIFCTRWSSATLANSTIVTMRPKFSECPFSANGNAVLTRLRIVSE